MNYEIREATADDRSEIINLYRLSQERTGIPDPVAYPACELGRSLYLRQAIERYVVSESAQIIGHGLIEQLNETDRAMWGQYIGDKAGRALALGAAFVHPEHFGKGTYTELLSLRLARVNELMAYPVAATWQNNEHVGKLFERFGGRQVATHPVGKLAVKLYVFDLSSGPVCPAMQQGPQRKSKGVKCK